MWKQKYINRDLKFGFLRFVCVSFKFYTLFMLKYKKQSII